METVNDMHRLLIATLVFVFLFVAQVVAQKTLKIEWDVKQLQYYPWALQILPATDSNEKTRIVMLNATCARAAQGFKCNAAVPRVARGKTVRVLNNRDIRAASPWLKIPEKP